MHVIHVFLSNLSERPKRSVAEARRLLLKQASKAETATTEPQKPLRQYNATEKWLFLEALELYGTEWKKVLLSRFWHVAMEAHSVIWTENLMI